MDGGHQDDLRMPWLSSLIKSLLKLVKAARYLNAEAVGDNHIEIYIHFETFLCGRFEFPGGKWPEYRLREAVLEERNMTLQTISNVCSQAQEKKQARSGPCTY